MVNHGAEGRRRLTFAYQVHNLEPTNELVLALARQLLELAHLLKVCSDLAQTLLICLLVQLLEEGNVSLEVLIVVANVDKGSEERGWEDHFEGLAILFN